MKEQVEHIFGHPTDLLCRGERLCNEPLIKNVRYERIFHVRFKMLADGNAECLHCKARFIDGE